MKTMYWYYPQLLVLTFFLDLFEGQPVLTLTEVSSIKNECGYVLFENDRETAKIDCNEGMTISEKDYLLANDNLQYGSNNVTVKITDSKCIFEICGLFHKIEETNVIVGLCILFNNNEYDVELQGNLKIGYSITDILSVGCGSLKTQEDIENYYCNNYDWYYFSKDSMRRSLEVSYWGETYGKVVKNCRQLSCPSEDFCKPNELKLGVCAMLFREFNCETCINEGLELKPEYKFNTSNSLLIKSISLHQDCTLYSGTETDALITYEHSEGFIDVPDNSDINFYWCDCIPEFGIITSTELTTTSKIKDAPSSVETPNTGLTGAQTTNSFTTIGNTNGTTEMQITSTTIKSTISITHTPTPTPTIQFSTTTPKRDPIIDPKKLNIGTTTAIATSSTLIVVLLLLALFSKMKQQLRTQLKNLLSKEDINELIKYKHRNLEAITEQGKNMNREDPLHFAKQIPINHLKIEKIIGRGNFGVVHLGEYQSEDNSWMNVAIKTVGTLTSLPDYKLLINEVRVMSILENHPNIVQFIGVHLHFGKTKVKILSVMELCSSNLLEHLQDLKRSLHEFSQFDVQKMTLGGYVPFPNNNSAYSKLQIALNYKRIATSISNDLLMWSENIATGMEYMHSKKLLHGDLSCRNILLAEDRNIAKISDFGLSKRLNDLSDYYRYRPNDDKLFMPVKWVAPETLEENQITKKSDIWSFGITLWEIFSLGCEPYAGVCEFAELERFLNSGQRLEQPEYATTLIYSQAMMRCWEINRELRPSFETLKIFFSSERAFTA